jgi:hypothetical protein
MKLGILLFLVLSAAATLLEAVLFAKATDHNFKGFVFIFGINLWGLRSSHLSKFGHGPVISPGVGDIKPNKISTFSYFSCCRVQRYEKSQFQF